MGRSGTGLGMAVVWGTVKDHRGIIDLKRIPGSGTNITIFFPAEQASNLSDDEQHRPHQAAGNGDYILVVDDVEQQREISVAMLTQIGYTASAVLSGEAAIAWLKNHSADLLILDMIMVPGIDGQETFCAIKKFKPTQKAVIATGYSETDRVRKAQMAGACRYIKKPYTIGELGSVVEESLAKAS